MAGVYDWVPSSITSALPENAVWCGKDEDDSDVYIGRVRHANTMLLVKIIPRRGVASFPYYDLEHNVTEYEVLVNHLAENAKWVPARNGQIPPNAVQCGWNKIGKKLYVGRTHHQGLHVPGYVHPHYQVIYYPFNFKEYFSPTYEVLVHNLPCDNAKCALE